MMPPVLPTNCEQPDEDSEEELRYIQDEPLPIITIAYVNSSPDSSSPTNDGYQLLLQHYLNEEDSELEEDEENVVSSSEDDGNVPFQTTEEAVAVVRDSANPPEQITKTIDMPPEHIEKIKDVMKGITLPASNLPVWTSNVPEDEWKAQLFAKLNISENKDQTTPKTD